MVWSKSSTEASKLLSELEQLVPTGSNIFLWFSWDFVLFPKRILVFVQQKQFTDQPSAFLENFWVFQSFHPIHSRGKFNSAAPKPLPNSLLQADFLFVCEDTFVPALSPLYRGPYKVLKCQDKFFCLQMGDKVDVVSVDRLKPVISDSMIIPARPPACGRPILSP